MGCGKSTLGLGLAKALGFEFIDLDKFIENRNFKSISEIFEKYGEEGFREIECKALKEVCEFSNVVIATGGGVPCFGDNMNLMNSSGMVVFIDIPISELVRRLIKSKTSRPIIKDLNERELMRVAESKLAERRPFYEQAQIVIRHINPSVEMLVSVINETCQR